tara:strand:- start:185 stop:940 length:756 start_codon:yes stop_codon:yes gene_type:complete
LDNRDCKGEWEEFRTAFGKLMKMGPVASVGEGPSSIKSTFLNQEGMYSTVFHPQHGELPLYCRRSGTNLPLTGFSKSVVFYPGWDSRQLLLKFGVRDKNNHSKALFTSLTPTPNTNHGLHVCTDSANNLILRDIGGNPIGMWSSVGLRKGFEKHRAFVIVDAIQTRKGGGSFFEFVSSSVMLRKSDLDDMSVLEELIRTNHISLELRMFITEDHPHCANRGLESDRVRDHGTAWRYSRSAMEKLFQSTPIA